MTSTKSIADVAAEVGLYKKGDKKKAYSPEVQKLVDAARAAVLKASPKSVRCPKCHKSKPAKKGFGVRTTKNKDGVPTYFALQSYCRKCRRPKKKGASKETQAPKKTEA